MIKDEKNQKGGEGWKWMAELVFKGEIAESARECFHKLIEVISKGKVVGGA